MLIVLTVLFFILWAPRTIFEFAFEKIDLNRFGSLLDNERVKLYIRYLSFLNSCVNPVVYAVVSE